MTMMKRLMTLMALMTLTACDHAERADQRKERSDGLYRSAMDDYRAGRLDAALKGFEKTIRRDPANASARFQLACLLQESRHDYVNAYFGYREYLSQAPDSDKAQVARDRLALCEKELAKSLATKHGLLGKNGMADELAVLQRELKSAQKRVATAEKEVEALRNRVSSLSAERERLLAVVKGVGAADAPAAVAGKPAVREVKDLLEEEDESTDRAGRAADIAALKSEEKDELSARPSVDVSALRKEEKDELSAGASILPVQTADDVARRKLQDAAKEKKKPAEPPRPATYVVQEGDTLYAVAKRFYGRLSAWREIRDANKAIISADNRLRAGETIKLP